MNWRIVSSLGEMELHGTGEHVSCPTTPADLAPSAFTQRTNALLDTPLEYPPLAASVVPGDRVALALDPSTPMWPIIAQALVERLETAGVERDGIQIVATRAPGPEELAAAPAGVALFVHEPERRESLAYLASTKQGTRIYLNRILVDADVVLPIGRIGTDLALGIRGPWSTVYPDLSEQPRIFSQSRGSQELTQAAANALAAEVDEVHWLLGSSFHLGVVPGVTGAAEVFAGAAPAVRTAGERDYRHLWGRSQHADLVIAAVGSPDQPASWDELAAALSAAHRSVTHGGKIVVIVRLAQSPAQALQRLEGLEQPRQFFSALRGAELDPDYEAAMALGKARSAADMYLLSNWSEQETSDLGLTALEHPREIDRLIARGDSCLILNRADLTQPREPEEA
jgi:nickel-dependent lactate racemase